MSAEQLMPLALSGASEVVIVAFLLMVVALAIAIVLVLRNGSRRQ